MTCLRQRSGHFRVRRRLHSRVGRLRNCCLSRAPGHVHACDACRINQSLFPSTRPPRKASFHEEVCAARFHRYRCPGCLRQTGARSGPGARARTRACPRTRTRTCSDAGSRSRSRSGSQEGRGRSCRCARRRAGSQEGRSEEVTAAARRERPAPRAGLFLFPGLCVARLRRVLTCAWLLWSVRVWLGGRDRARCQAAAAGSFTGHPPFLRPASSSIGPH
jgi:hypothetical protein